MPFESIYEGETVAPHQVPFRADAECPDCGGTVRVWRSTERHARHFKHVDKIGQSGAGGPTAAPCEYAGETDKHRKWKSLALSKLTAVFDDVSEKNYYTGEDEAVIGVSEAEEEKKLPAPATSREFCKADVAVMFNERDEQLGRGVAVEVQHKNKAKNKLASIVDYVEQDMSVVWMYENDFSSDACLLNEADIRQRAADAVPNPELWPRCGVSYEIERVRDELASEWLAKCRSLSEDSNPIVPATVPGEYLCQRAGWKWSDVLTEYPQHEFVAQGIVPDEPVSTVVSATFPEKWRRERAGEILTTVGPASEFKPDVYCESHLPDSPEYARVPVSVPNNIRYSELVQDQNISDPDRPSNPFNDIQCRVCGMYWHYTKEHQICPDCGRPVDWQWNIQTNRIDEDVVPDTVTDVDAP